MGMAVVMLAAGGLDLNTLDAKAKTLTITSISASFSLIGRALPSCSR
jgi:hypothetical protein